MRNINSKVVEDFGTEWRRFDQASVPESELKEQFDRYFAVFPWDRLPDNAQGFDLGCGSGRWAKFVYPKVGKLHCVDPSNAALEVAKSKLGAALNCEFHLAASDTLPFDDNSMDFCYSLGVLHHIPDTSRGIADCVEKLKPGGIFLVYLYYAFDTKPWWFVTMWRVSDLARRVICRMPRVLKTLTTDAVALIVYLPLSRTAKLANWFGIDVANWPLSTYMHKSLYTLRTDALDRFGTSLESRFTREQISQMMVAAGLTQIRFSDEAPFWCASGKKL